MRQKFTLVVPVRSQCYCFHPARVLVDGGGGGGAHCGRQSIPSHASKSLPSSARSVRWHWHPRQAVSPPASGLAHITTELGSAHETCELQSGIAAHIKSLSAPRPIPSALPPTQATEHLSSSLHRPSPSTPPPPLLPPPPGRSILISPH